MASHWDLAGLTDSRSRLGRLVPGTRITVPAWIELSLDRRELIFGGGPPDAKVRVRHTQADRNLLNQFVQLWDKKPELILRFARKWGVLYLDEYGRPCQPNGPFERRELIEVWKYFSRRAQAVLNIAANLKLGRLGDLVDWDALRGTEYRSGNLLQEMDRHAPFLQTMLPRIEYPFNQRRKNRSVDPGYRRSVKGEVTLLSLEATLWLKLGRVGFVVSATDATWTLSLDYGECMLAAVALQLALVLAEVEALYTCDGCHKPYVRTKRAPKRGEANFCLACGRKKAVQGADRRRRWRRAEAKRLAREGVPAQSIAKRLGSSLAAVRSWTAKKLKTSPPGGWPDR
jgi:hypothetical protein